MEAGKPARSARRRSGTGSAGMETCFVNLLEPGDSVLIGVNGVFGTRMVDVAQRCGAQVDTVEAAWGAALDPQQFKSALAKKKYQLAAIVHAETSTGVLQPLDDIAKLVRESGALLMVDAVTSLGGAPVRVDELGIDACYSGTQKCLGCPPGLSPVTFRKMPSFSASVRRFLTLLTMSVAACCVVGMMHLTRGTDTSDSARPPSGWRLGAHRLPAPPSPGLGKAAATSAPCWRR